jgi:tetratricopeptide (TPR) repeat protein
LSKASKAQQLEFWALQRAAMNALKIEQDPPKAIRLFEQALALNPTHEDSRYYLGNSLAAQGRMTEALVQLQELTRLNPQSHRGFAQWGTLRALSAASDADLAAAEKALERAHELNPEETGALLSLGEVALLRGDLGKAERCLANACRTNPKAVGGFFLRAYIAWKQGDPASAEDLLRQARQALGKDWQPKGTTAEGDVARRQHVEKTPLARCWEEWAGTAALETAFGPLEKRLRRNPTPGIE